MTLWGSDSCGSSNANDDRARSFDADSLGIGAFTHIGACLFNSVGVSRNIFEAIFLDEGGGNDSLLETAATHVVADGTNDCSDGTGREETYSVVGDPSTGETYWIAWSDDTGGRICFDSESNSSKQSAGVGEQDFSSLSDSSYKVSVWAQITAGVPTGIEIFRRRIEGY